MTKLLSYSEAAKILTVAEVTLRRWTSERSIPFIKLNRAVRFDVAELEKWIHERSVPAQGGKR